MLQVNLLGEQSVTDDDGRVRARSSRALLLVAYLVVHAGVPQTRQHLAALFWPDSADDQALTNLRRELHRVKAMLGDDPALVVTARDLCWTDSPTCRADVRSFALVRAAARAAAAAGDEEQQLARAGAAVACYRGEFMPGGFDDWVLDARAELEQQCVDLLDMIAGRDTGDAAIAAARRRVGLRPLEEPGYRRLMELQAAAGDRAAAVSTYHRCASVLERELGVDPDPRTRATLERLLAPTAPQTAPPARVRSGPAAARLVGRTDELARLRAAWRAAADRPGLVVVRGEPGVGKSRLVAELAAECRRAGAVVAVTQGFGSAGRLALAPVADWLRAPEIRAATQRLDPVRQAEIDRLVPSAGTPEATTDTWQGHRLFDAVTRALVAVDRPLLLVVDNLHWCDQETLAFLTFCLGAATGAPLLVAATARDADPDQEPGLPEWLARMRTTQGLTEIEVHPFEVADTATLAAAATGHPLDDDAAALLQATTGGFPLHVVEAVRCVDPGDPGDLGSVLRHRLDAVSPPARAVAGLAAAVGRDFTLDLLGAASDLPDDAVVAAVDELWRQRILRETWDGYDFAHDLLRACAYEQAGPPTRWLSHRRVARALEVLHAGDLDAVSAQLAEQYARGGRGARAVGWYRRAAAVASGRYAHAEAVRLLDEARSALAAAPAGRGRDTDELAVLEATAAPLNALHGYSSPRLRDTLERSVELATALGDRGATLSGLVGLWSSQFVSGDVTAAHVTASRALGLVDAGSELAGPAHFAVGGSELILGRPAEALRHLDRSAEIGGNPPLSVGTRSDVHGRAFAAHAHWLLGHDEAALTTCRDAIELARTTGSSYGLAVALGYGAVTHQLRDDRDALRDTVAELRELCARFDFTYYREWAMVLDGWCRGGAAGADLADRGIEGLTGKAALVRMPYWLSLRADLAARDGRTGEARTTLDAAVAGVRARDESWWLPEALRMRAAHDDDHDTAAERLATAARLAADQGSVALLRRCLADFTARGVPAPEVGLPEAG
ncbi:SARP family transcriptional regulator [Pseudonocardia sulfidoxydans NBRC 16205]|uniref:SARP family transcriptional regulator n=2 Tax=Pseudonocardia sulfidoxydans TaxID=54011 RepID=A0A511DL33_9PSEU|nr:AAA family ATPase [Pseudonocardia sulfidoxydans]GEL25107.1 SARP family transcriptional regulator [Pseudonocardia sulfidoxydans NBRC 16205]